MSSQGAALIETKTFICLITLIYVINVLLFLLFFCLNAVKIKEREIK